MSQTWVSCSVCSKSFVPRFSYQTDDSYAGGARHYCSVGCRTPELRGEPRGRSDAGADSSLHTCSVCQVRFEIRYAFQIVSSGKSRRVVCTEPCRATLIAADRAQEAERSRTVRAIAV